MAKEETNLQFASSDEEPVPPDDDAEELVFTDDEDEEELAFTDDDADDESVFADEDDANEFVFADQDDESVLADEEEDRGVHPQDGWKIMIVDDEMDVHQMTTHALEGFTFEDRPLTFISAYSGEAAMDLMQKHPDTALILLDVVMEVDHAGLEVAKYIREKLRNQLVRIVLRTGQPGQAPEQDVMINYDINDYKAKTELTAQRLSITIITALRSFRDLANIEVTRDDLKQLVEATERFVPRQFLSFLQKRSLVDVRIGDQVEAEMTVMFSSIRNFVELSDRMTPEENFKFVNAHLSQMEPIIPEHHGFIDKYMGKGIMALFPTCADDAVRGSIAMLHRLGMYNQSRQNMGDEPIRIGIGLHTGDLILGTVGGENRMDGTVISDAVNLASRIEGMTKLYGASLLISESTFSRLREQYAIRGIDRVRAKGKSGAVTVYEVFDGEPAQIIDLKRQTLNDFEDGVARYRQKEFALAAELFNQVLQMNTQDKAASLYLKRCQQFQKYGVPQDWDGTAALEEK